MAEDQEKKAENDEAEDAPEASEPESAEATPDAADDADEAPSAEDATADGEEADDTDAADANDEDADDANDAEAADETESEVAASSESDDSASANEAKTGPRKKKTGRKKKDPKVTAGQRLAAAKATKAAKKAAQRGRDAELMEDKATQRAEEATEMLDKHRNTILAAIAAVALLAAGYFGWQAMSKSTAAEAAAVLWAAEETSRAPVVEEGEDAPEDADETYPSEEARAEAALEKFREVISDHGSSEAAVYAHLGAGRMLSIQGEYEQARSAFESALAQGGDDPNIAGRAVEGIAFTYEAEEAWDEARNRYDELAGIDGDDNELRAKLHRARLHLLADEEDEAKTILLEIIESLNEEDAPELPFVRDQTELALMAIDSSLVQRSSGATMLPGMGGMGGGMGGPGGGSQLSPEQIQELIKQMQTKGGGG